MFLSSFCVNPMTYATVFKSGQPHNLPAAIPYMLVQYAIPLPEWLPVRLPIQGDAPASPACGDVPEPPADAALAL